MIDAKNAGDAPKGKALHVEANRFVTDRSRIAFLLGMRSIIFVTGMTMKAQAAKRAAPGFGLAFVAAALGTARHGGDRGSRNRHIKSIPGLQ